MAISCIFVLFALFSLTISGIESSKSNGFSIDLIHRDSPKSPFYNPSETQSTRIREALQRSKQRVHRFTRKDNSVSPNTAETDIVSAGGEYLMSLSIGTPTFEILAIADTGSDLIWTQCKPCTNCFEQTQPLFDPKESSTYRNVACGTDQCKAAGIRGQSCAGTDNSCQYSVQYGDKSYSNGVVAADTFTLGSTSARNVKLPKTVFGCGFDSAGTFNGVGSGIIGLGGGQESLISQMSSQINGKFSYCLIPLYAKGDNTSKINFGSNGIVSGRGVVSTPLVEKDPPTFYYLTLEGISVGDERVEFDESSPGNVMEEGNIIIDSGTTLTILPQEFYGRLRAVVADQVRGASEITDPGNFLDLCYDSPNDLSVPNMTVHFKGADVKLNKYNTFVRVSDNVVCFAFAPVDSVGIYGNLAQMNFLVGYDAQERTVSFKAADCTDY